MNVRFLAITLAACSLAACGGGGGTSPTPVAPKTAPTSAATSAYGTVTLSIAVPAVAASAKTRMPKYVSASTYQAAIVVTPPGQAALPVQIFVCTVPAGGVGKVCAGSVSAPPGAESVAVTLEDRPQAGQTRGNALSQGSLVVIVNQGASTAVNAVLDGVVHDVAVVFPAQQVKYAPSLPYSAASQGTQTVTTYAAVNAYDRDGNVITYNGGYVDANGNNVAVGLSANALCGGSANCGVTLGTTSVSGPGSLIPITATLNDSVSQYSEALTVTPSITFGNPGGTVTPGTVNFVRPSTCNAYLPYISSLNAASLSAVNNVSVNGESATRLVWNDIRFGTLQNAQSLDPRIAYDLNLSASPVNPGPYPINGAVGTYRIQNGALSFVGPQPSNLDAAAFAADQRAGLSPSLTNGTATAYFVPTGIQQITMSFEFDLDGVGNLCNDSVPLPYSFPSLSTFF